MQHLTIRRFEPPPAGDVARHWFHGEPAATHLLNAYTLLVPDNEGFYIRTLNQAVPGLQDIDLRNAVREFSRQEGQHGVAHRRAWQWLAAQGYRFDAFVKLADKAAFAVVEKLAPLPLRVAIVACVEHLNAAIGHEYLRRGLMDGVDPAVRSLFEWHFAEEIEHKAVAFDVLQTFRGAYALRLLATVLVVPLFYLLMGLGAAMLCVQDGSARRASTWRGWFSHVFGRRAVAWGMARHLGAYLLRGFRPWQLDDRRLAAAALARWPNVVPVQPAMPAPASREPAIAPARAA
jgi:predicted metal-dependent hydrolase